MPQAPQVPKLRQAPRSGFLTAEVSAAGDRQAPGPVVLKRQPQPSALSALPAFEPTATQEVVVGEVIGLAPGFDLAEVETADGRAFALTIRTPGIDVGNVRPGQRYRCLVTRRLPRVLRAELVA